MWDIFKTGVVLMLYTIVAGALLTLVYIKTAPVIEANKLAAAGDSVRAEVLPDMRGGYQEKGSGTDFPYWIGFNDSGKKNPGGYIFIARGKGYQSTIETMVGVKEDGTIAGVKILSQQETPGLGDKVEEIRSGETDPWFTRQFYGRSASENPKVKKDGGDIDAIAGATISSRAVTESINRGLKKLMEIVGGMKYEQKEETSESVPDTAQTETEKEPIGISPEDVISEVLPNMTGGYQRKGEESDFPYWIGSSDSGQSSPGGYVFIARGEGFASTIETMVGVNTDGKIVGVKILSHEETPGYGGRMEEIREGETDPWFTRQFIGKTASDNIALIEDNGDIDAISEATISSRAVTKSINDGLKKLMDILKCSEQ